MIKMKDGVMSKLLREEEKRERKQKEKLKNNLSSD